MALRIRHRPGDRSRVGHALPDPRPARRPRAAGDPLGAGPAGGSAAPASVPADRGRSGPGRRGVWAGPPVAGPPPHHAAGDRGSVMGTTLARLLAAAVRMLPTQRRELGQGLLAELPAVPAG